MSVSKFVVAKLDEDFEVAGVKVIEDDKETLAVNDVTFLYVVGDELVSSSSKLAYLLLDTREYRITHNFLSLIRDEDELTRAKLLAVSFNEKLPKFLLPEVQEAEHYSILDFIDFLKEKAEEFAIFGDKSEALNIKLIREGIDSLVELFFLEKEKLLPTLDGWLYCLDDNTCVKILVRG